MTTRGLPVAVRSPTTIWLSKGFSLATRKGSRLRRKAMFAPAGSGETAKEVRPADTSSP